MNERKKNDQRPSYRKADFEGKGRRQTVEKMYYDNADMMILFNVTNRTLQRWRDEGVFPFKKVGGKIYYLKQKVDEYMNNDEKTEEDQDSST